MDYPVPVTGDIKFQREIGTSQGESAANMPDEDGKRTLEWFEPHLGGYGECIEEIITLVGLSHSVLSAWLHGSRAIGSDNRKSDLDILILIRTADDSARVAGDLARMRSLQVNRNFPDYFTLTPVPFWSTPAGELGLRIISLEQIRERISRLLESPDGLEEQQAFIQHAIIEARPLNDPGCFLGECQRRIARLPSEFFRELSEKYLRLLTQKILWWEIRPQWKNVFERLSDMAIIIEELSRLHYAINRRLFMPGMKEYERDLSTLKPDLSEFLTSAAVLGPDRSDNELRQLIRCSVEALQSHASFDPEVISPC